MSTPAGWYPQGNSQRYWDGENWTEHIAPLPPIYQVAPKSSGIAYLLFLLLGGLGAHKFYLNQPGFAVTQILLWWGGWALSAVGIGIAMLVVVVIWWFVDLITLPNQVLAANIAAAPR